MTHARPTPRTTTESWALARRDFLAGDTAPVVAERYGFSERTLRRRAAVEGWRRRDIEPEPLAVPPTWLRPPLSREEAIERDPELGEVQDAEGSDRFFLLFDSTPKDLRRFAFRQASEAAAIDKPQQAAAWMRLIALVDRCGDRVEEESRAFRDIDYLRAAYLRRLGQGDADPAEGGDLTALDDEP